MPADLFVESLREAAETLDMIVAVVACLLEPLALRPKRRPIRLLRYDKCIVSIRYARHTFSEELRIDRHIRVKMKKNISGESSVPPSDEPDDDSVQYESESEIEGNE